MADSGTITGVFSIGDTDTMGIPVADIESGIEYYESVLGFRVESRTPDAAVLARDGCRIGIVVNGRDPEQASCYFAVTDLDAVRKALAATGRIDVGEQRIDEHGGNRYRVFFAREPFGVCFCFGTRI